VVPAQETGDRSGRSGVFEEGAAVVDGGPEGPVWEDDLGLGGWADGLLPYAGRHADYAKSAGTLLGAEPLVVKDAFEQVAPKSATVRIPGGDRQVLLALRCRIPADPAKEYAVPVGMCRAGDFTFYTDEIFFYDDPHELYKHWGTKIWAAVDAHQVILGMNEREVELSLGQVSKSVSTITATGW